MFKHSEKIVNGKLLSKRKVIWPLLGLKANIESPLINQAFRDRIEVKGWAIDSNDDAVTIDVMVNGNCVKRVDATEPRQDVENYFELHSPQTAKGFRHFIYWNDLGEQRDAATISLRINKGRQSFNYGPLPVRRTDDAMNASQRANYKEFWEHEASNKKIAMLSVAGTANAEEFSSSGIGTAATLAQHLEISRDDTVLEIGCGIARIGVVLSPMCRQWIGTDISAAMLELAGQQLEQANIKNYRLEELNGCSLRAFSDATIDKVYCSTVFMHLDEWDRYAYVKEAFRVLRPGGKLYIDNINLAGDVGWEIFEQMAIYDPVTRPANISKASTEQELLIYLQRAGFGGVKSFPDAHYVAVLGTKPA